MRSTWRVADFGGSIGGKKIAVVHADHQNKPDIASTIARQWFDSDGVDVIVNAAGSSVALAVVEIAKERNKAVLVTGAVTNRLTQDACTPNHVHYGLDNYALVNGTVSALLEQGKKTWFFLVADYAFGHSFLADATGFIERRGGSVLGSVKHPLNSSDFGSYLLQAKASGAQVVGLANAATDMTNSIAQAQEFGIVQGGQSIAATIMFITDVNAMGLEKAQGTILTTAFYWDMDDRTRDYGKRFHAKIGRMPTFYQAADYSATSHYLKAAARAGWGDGRRVIADMKTEKVNDFFGRGGYIREDGLLVHDIFLARGQEAVGVDAALGLLRDPGDDSRRRRIPAALGVTLPPGREAVSSGPAIR
ncbi:MAG: ABC transporter substrate-binding protein [Pseudomonadota bacterium]